MTYHKVILNDKIFFCSSEETIIEASLKNGVFLNHSCLSGRCSSCKSKILRGESISIIEESSLSEKEKSEGFVLSCIRMPISDLELEAEDLSQYGFNQSVTIPAKINSIQILTSEIIQVNLRVPPNQKVSFLEGQYLNVIWNGIKRSYSMASSSLSPEIELIIKNYQGGVMSSYWFGQAKPNDLLRLEVPKGTFFLKNHPEMENLVFLATGTGIAPIKSILESPSTQDKIGRFKRIIVLWGMKYHKEIFWKPSSSEIEFIPVLSRGSQPKRYVQDLISNLNLDMAKTVVYACGSNEMIQEAKNKSIQLGLNLNHFYSDAFVASN